MAAEWEPRGADPTCELSPGERGVDLEQRLVLTTNPNWLVRGGAILAGAAAIAGLATAGRFSAQSSENLRLQNAEVEGALYQDGLEAVSKSISAVTDGNGYVDLQLSGCTIEGVSFKATSRDNRVVDTHSYSFPGTYSGGEVKGSLAVNFNNMTDLQRNLGQNPCPRLIARSSFRVVEAR